MISFMVFVHVAESWPHLISFSGVSLPATESHHLPGRAQPPDTGCTGCTGCTGSPEIIRAALHDGKTLFRPYPPLLQSQCNRQTLKRLTPHPAPHAAHNAAP